MGAVHSSTVLSSISSSIYSRSICSSSGDVLCLHLLHADSTAADQVSWKVSSISSRLRFAEHVAGVECSQPVAVRVGVVVAGSSAMTLDEGNLPEVFQTGPR